MRLLVLRTPTIYGVLILILLITLASSAQVSAARKMKIQASVNPTQTDHGISVVISGRVFELVSNASISNAEISIQVNNPQGTSIHVAITYTDNLGVLKDSFPLVPNSPGGNYTAFLVASKPGYDTESLTLIFSYSTPDFSIESSTNSLSLKQGDTSSLTATILSLRDFKDSVNITAIDQPQGVTIQASPSSLVPSGTVTLNVGVSLSAPVGNYTITILAVSGSLTHKATFLLSITQGPIQANFALLAGGAGSAIVLGAVGLVLRFRGRRKRKEAALEELLKQASADTGYVATARVLARLEELRAMNKVDESTYQSLKKEYEKRLEKST
jgi:hypothetical protein